MKRRRNDQAGALSRCDAGTVENFLKYVNAGQYNGTQFHRVIKGFMIQGGGYDAEFRERPTRPAVPIESELSVKGGLSNQPGTVAMARTGDPNSATSQFFINVGDNKRLDFKSADPQGYGYTVFGKVIAGMDVVDKIGKGATGSGGRFPTAPPVPSGDVPCRPWPPTPCSRKSRS